MAISDKNFLGFRNHIMESWSIPANEIGDVVRIATQEESQKCLCEFIDLCVIQEKKSRFLYFMEHGQIEKFVHELNHFQRNLNSSSMVNIGEFLNYKKILSAFHFHENETVFAISYLRGMERGVITRCDIAVNHVFKSGCGAVICSMKEKEKFFIYNGEETKEQYVWTNSRR